MSRNLMFDQSITGFDPLTDKEPEESVPMPRGVLACFDHQWSSLTFAVACFVPAE